MGSSTLSARPKNDRCLSGSVAPNLLSGKNVEVLCKIDRSRGANFRQPTSDLTFRNRVRRHSFEGTSGTQDTKAMQTNGLNARLPTRGRQTKFTPEKLQQIRELVQRGTRREEIAELI